MKAECPQCHHEFDAKRSTNGASYVDEWESLTVKNMAILRWLMFNHPHEKMSMTDLYMNFSKEQDIMMKRNPFQARISELRRAGAICANKEVKKSRHDTVKPCMYWLDLPRARELLVNGGKL